ncbi:MAG: hypothetical protein AAFY27_07980, partial [Pseudomonadota bacterium]
MQGDGYSAAQSSRSAERLFCFAMNIRLPRLRNLLGKRCRLDRCRTEIKQRDECRKFMAKQNSRSADRD